MELSHLQQLACLQFSEFSLSPFLLSVTSHQHCIHEQTHSTAAWLHFILFSLSFGFLLARRSVPKLQHNKTHKGSKKGKNFREFLSGMQSCTFWLDAVPHCTSCRDHFKWAIMRSIRIPVKLYREQPGSAEIRNFCKAVFDLPRLHRKFSSQWLPCLKCFSAMATTPI